MRRFFPMLAAVLLTTVMTVPTAAGAATAPKTPTGFTVTATSATTLDLKWNASTGATSYRIWHGTNANGTGATLTTATGTTARITGLTPGTTYHLDIAAKNSSGQSPYTPKLAKATVPATPTGFAVSGTGTTWLDLKWNASAGATGYRIWHGTNANGSAATLTSTSGTTTRITGLTPGTTYHLDIAAQNASGWSSCTPRISAATTTSATPSLPPTPTGFTASAVSTTSIDLTWNASANATGYRIWHGTNANGTGAKLTSTSGTTTRITGLVADTTYHLDIAAENGAGRSEYTPRMAVRTAPASGPATRFTSWSTTDELSRGTLRGVRVVDGTVQIHNPDQRLTYADPYGSGSREYEYGTWTSPWEPTGFAATTLVPSWNVSTTSTAWIQVDLRVRNASQTSSWDTAASWAWGRSSVSRHSMTAQDDDIARMVVDTLRTNGSATFTEWQVQVKLLRPVGATSQQATMKSVHGVASAYATRTAATSSTTMTADRELSVPRYSQMIHRNHLTQFDGGGAAWCSPTSTSMVLRFFGSGPVPSAYASEASPDGWIDHAARNTYDHRYRGTGNWSFNTAYAGGYDVNAFVTRLADLRDAEAFIRAGIPVVTSIAFGSGGLTGAPLTSTPGHLMVVVGFTKDGKVIANDPAAPANSSVRRVYDRAQFEKAWLGGSGGIAYVIRPESHPLPAATARW